MPYEEDEIARLDQGAVDAKASDEARRARYVGEDAVTAAKRAKEDLLATNGAALRDERRSELEALIKARYSPAPSVTAQQAADLLARIAGLEQKLGVGRPPAVTQQ